MVKKYTRAIYLFNRDLRRHDNELLKAAASQSSHVLAVFIFTKSQTSARNKYLNIRSVQFMAESLVELAKTINVNFYYGDTDDVMRRLVDDFRPDALYNNFDVSPFAIARSAELATICKAADVEFIQGRDIFLCRHSDLLKSDGSPYLKFTPFYNNAISHIAREKPAPATSCINFIKLRNEHTILGQKKLCELIMFNRRAGISQTAFVPGRTAAVRALRTWARAHINYKKSRDVICLDATSHLSAYLHFGILGPVEVIDYLRQIGNQNRKEILRQLMWREFYLYIVWKHHTDYTKLSRSLPLNNHIRWHTDQKAYMLWTRGQTGCPIVDAGMRELAATGYMQNRARMIVAMYLIYHLKLDWRLGEIHFARNLTDYDYCNNLGGWLWCAGWEVYSNDWFRPFSMASQFTRFDPDAKYVHRWCPELSSVEPRDLYDWSSNVESMNSKYPEVRYVAPIISDLKSARESGIAMYKRAHI